jgi:uncharacterized protein
MKNILITGGSGMIGRALTDLLRNAGHTVFWLSSNRNLIGNDIFYWNVYEKRIDEKALINADSIVHLAGANVGEKRWTNEYKQEIIDSRVKSADFIFESLKKIPNKVKVVLGASAIGFYGECGDDWCIESDRPGNDFLAQVCVKWEQAIQQITSLSIRTVSLRTGIVLATQGGALKPLKASVKLGMSPIFGDGKQFYSWIHVNDLCGMYSFALENESMQGVYNAVAPNPLRYTDFVKQIAHACDRPFIPLPVPTGLLKIVRGEFAETLATSTRCSAGKIMEAGYQFQYHALSEALENLIKA